MDNSKNNKKHQEKEPVIEVVSNVTNLRDDLIGHYVDDFLKNKKRTSMNTHDNYKVDIEQFFNEHFGKSYRHVTTNELNGPKGEAPAIVEYFNNMANKEDLFGKPYYSNSTINRKQSSIKQLLKYLKMRRVYTWEVGELELINQLPSDTNSIEVIPFDVAMQYAEWFKHNEKTKPLEKYIITKMAIDTGLRATELIDLKWSQFTVEEGVDYVLIKGKGKGGKKWIEKISLEFFKEIEQLKTLPDRAGGVAEGKVFTLKYHTLPNMMNRAKKAFGHEDRNYSFHSFKKTAVTSTYRLTGDFLEAAKKGRHSSLNTTRMYTEEEDYGITGLISLGGDVDAELYKKVEHSTLLEAIEKMNTDFKFILNYKIKQVEKQKEEE